MAILENSITHKIYKLYKVYESRNQIVSAKAIREELGINYQTFYNSLRRLREEGIEVLVDRVYMSGEPEINDATVGGDDVEEAIDVLVAIGDEGLTLEDFRTYFPNSDPVALKQKIQKVSGYMLDRKRNSDGEFTWFFPKKLREVPEPYKNKRYWPKSAKK